MPSLAHLVARQSISLSGGGGGITPTAIGLIVGIGIIPAIILIFVVSWLFWCYPYNRICCCTRRKKMQPDPEVTEPYNGVPYRGVVSSGENVQEKRVDAFHRPDPPSRFESGSSYGSPAGNRLTKNDPRFSLQTIDSSYNGRTNQEPQRFV
jgi:hypothetical protein